MLNRKEPPPIHLVGHLPLPEIRTVRLRNGMPVYLLDYPGQEILKIEVIYLAGRPEESAALVARATARLIREGSRSRSGAAIAELMDFYGSTFSNPTSLDTADFVLYTLRKYAAEVVPVFAEAILEPSFPEEELRSFQENSIRELQVELDKVEVLAYRQLTEAMFGMRHPYGYNSTPEAYRALRLADLRAHHQRWFTPATGMIFVSGGIDDHVLQLLENSFGQTPSTGARAAFHWNDSLPTPSVQHIPHPNSLQTAIKIGRRLFNRHHPDYNGMYVLNTILGGYFGSRLMMNIREKRGYTYNIYATVDTMQHDGYFYIATEVNSDKTAATLRQIFKELQSLREKPVPEQELDMVRNYLLGMLLNGLDGPINTSDLVKGLISEDLPLEAFYQQVEIIRSITPETIQELANRYLQPQDLWTVTVG